MNRRDFLKNLFGAAAIAATPAPVLAALLDETSEVTDFNGFRINWTIKRVEYIGDTDKTYTVLELYQYLAEQWKDDVFDMPIDNSGRVIELDQGWKIDHDAMSHLRAGTIIQGDEIWTGIYSDGIT